MYGDQPAALCQRVHREKTGRWQRFSGKGRLADVRIDAIQNFWGLAIQT